MEKLNFMIAVELALADVTDEYIDACNGALPEKLETEKVLGTIESVDVRRLWAALQRLRARMTMVNAEADLSCDAGARQRAREETCRASQLADVLREAFWFEAEDAIAYWALDKNTLKGYGPMYVRAGWLVVAAPVENPLSIFLGRVPDADG